MLLKYYANSQRIFLYGNLRHGPLSPFWSKKTVPISPLTHTEKDHTELT